MRLYLVGLLAIVSPLPSASGQSSRVEDWRWVSFGVAEGLPSPIVNVVSRASDGTMWAGTDDGPAWFDGSRWQRVHLADGRAMAGLRVTRLVAGNGGSMVVALGARLYRVAARGRGVALLPADPSALTMPEDFVVDGDDVWRTYSRADRWTLSHFTGGAWHDEAWPGRAPGFGFEPRLYRTADGRLALTVGGTLWVRDGTSWMTRWTLFAGSGVITHYVPSSRGAAWVVVQSPHSQQGVWTHGVGAGQAGWRRVTQFGREAPVAVDVGPDGSATAILGAGDFLYFDTGGWRRLLAQPRLATTRSLAFDATGDVWFATRRGVVLWRRQSERWTQWRVPAATPVNRVNAIAVAPDERVAIATAGGIAWLDSAGRVRLDDGLPKTVFTSVAWDADGALWAGSGGTFAGIYQQTNGRWTHRGDIPGMAQVGIHRIVPGRDGSLWLPDCRWDVRSTVAARGAPRVAAWNASRCRRPCAARDSTTWPRTRPACAGS